MEFRNGAYTSWSKRDDLELIIRLARKIKNGEEDPIDHASRIERLAWELIDELS